MFCRYLFLLVGNFTCPFFKLQYYFFPSLCGEKGWGSCCLNKYWCSIVSDILLWSNKLFKPISNLVSGEKYISKILISVAYKMLKSYIVLFQWQTTLFSVDIYSAMSETGKIWKRESDIYNNLQLHFHIKLIKFIL